MIPDKKTLGTFSKVLSCVIYTILRNYLCIDYLGSDIFFQMNEVLVLVSILNM